MMWSIASEPVTSTDMSASGGRSLAAPAAEVNGRLAPMRISECFGRGQPVVSFEFFPPKTEAGFARLFETIAELKRLAPSFVSVTWGAGGSTRRQTIEIVTRIEREIGLTAMAHLTCVGSSAAELAEILDRLAAAGLENVLALSGDPPRDQPDYQTPPGGFTYARQLVEFIRSRWSFCIAAACYPETHPRAESPEADLAHLAAKVRAGAQLLITQLFFDNADYFAFVERARAAGIEVPIVPGIMPVVSESNIRRITALSGARIPDALDAELRSAGGDPERTLEVGVAWATVQCRELLARGAPGLHFYTLNQSPATRRIYESLFG
jgi:methylenetetrahydrofolate reductase (NADPH)